MLWMILDIIKDEKAKKSAALEIADESTENAERSENGEEDA